MSIFNHAKTDIYFTAYRLNDGKQVCRHNVLTNFYLQRSSNPRRRIFRPCLVWPPFHINKAHLNTYIEGLTVIDMGTDKPVAHHSGEVSAETGFI